MIQNYKTKILGHILAMLFAAIPIFLEAQGVTSAQLSGIVRDGNGNPIDAATVQAIHTPSGTVYGVYTRPDGRYIIPNMRIGGPYKIIISYVGFKTQTQEGIYLSLGQQLKFNGELKEESVALEEVTVSGAKNVLLNSEKTGAGTNITKEMMASMPTLSRSLGDYLRFTPQSRSSSVASTTGNAQSFAGQDSRFNNLTIDGSIFNNNFGLAGSNGGQTNSTPISLDAIEEIQVNIAPYDVRQGGFTGAGVNAVTKSGTNTLSGSAFYNLRNQDLAGKKADTVKIVKNDFFINQSGLSLGGPLIKDKLFYFVNYEQETRDDPSSGFVAFRDSTSTPPSASNVSRANAKDLDNLRQFLVENYNYDPGRYEKYLLDTRSKKGMVKLDFNANARNRASLRFNFLKSNRDVLSSNSGAIGNRTPSRNALNFEASNYIINNDIYSGIFELNTIVSNKISNQFQFGYTANRDYRDSRGGIFPLIDILQNGQTLTTFGYEPFTPNNRLNTDTWQFKNDVSFYSGNHNITAGINFEYFKFENVFTPTYYGQYIFNSLNDFYKAANGDSVGLARYQLTYSALPGAEVPTAITKAFMPGIYLQDEFSMLNDRLKLTAGIRLDVPVFGNTALYNPKVDTMLFYNTDDRLTKYRTDELPEPQFMISPRIGFNWDVLGERKLQLRGGTGVFTGRPPFVWISNQVGNNGILTGSFTSNNTNTKLFPFSQDVTRHIPANPTTPANYNLALTELDFKFPQLWRTDLGVDVKLPWKLVGTLEFMYSQNLNAINYINGNLEPSVANFAGPDNRPYFNGLGLSSTAQNNALRVEDVITDAIILGNNSKGSAYSYTVKLERPADKQWYFMAAYNFAEAKDIITGGSIAFSSWRDNRTVNGNNRPDLAFSDFDQRHRIIGAVSYKTNYSKRTFTTISLFGQSGNQNRATFSYNGDYNGDGIQNNDLLYIPNDASELTFRTLSREFTNSDGTKTTITVTPEQQAAAFNELINANEYLSENKGKYLERNGMLLPWLTTFDLTLAQDILLGTSDCDHRIQFRVDIANFGNMLNSKWGVGDFLVNTNIINATNAKNAENKPLVTFGEINSARQYQKLSGSLLRKGVRLDDVWQMQLGIRYIF